MSDGWNVHTKSNVPSVSAVNDVLASASTLSSRSP